MSTVLYVHGTGVRQRAYDYAFDELTDGLRRVRPGFSVAPCCWGGSLGATLRADGACFPRRDSAREIPDDRGVPDLWTLLDLDPLFELRVLGTAAPQQGELPPNVPALFSR